MAELTYPLSMFGDEFLWGRPDEDHEPSDRPTSLLQAAWSMSRAQLTEYLEACVDGFSDIEPEDIVERAIVVNKVTNPYLPVEVWLDHEGRFTVKVYARPSKASKYPYTVGTRVVALCRITEDGACEGDPEAEMPHPAYIHAEPGDEGVVEDLNQEEDIPSVRFDRTGTATIVFEPEIKEVGE